MPSRRFAARTYLCCVCSSPRWFSHGSPSREVMLRNVAGVSRLAEQTPHQPCLLSFPPLLSPPPHLPAFLLLVSLCSKASQLISVPSGWIWLKVIGSHVADRKRSLDMLWIQIAVPKIWKCCCFPLKLSLFVSVCIHAWEKDERET